MLKINSPLYKLITILFRQINFSIARYSQDEGFCLYFKDKEKHYKYAIIELEKIIESNHDYYPFLKMIKNKFFTKRVNILNIFLIYKVLKEFEKLLLYSSFQIIYETKIHLTSMEIHVALIENISSLKERRIIAETEHYEQNLMFSHYTSIEETLKRLNIQVDINEDGKGTLSFI